jgi:hypothetical protein
MVLLRTFLTLLVAPSSPQNPGPLGAAAETITAADVARRISVVADDSMMGRGTPSVGLERTAHYVASEFRRAGLRPAGDSGSYIQQFGIVRWVVDPAESRVEFAAGGTRALIRIGTDARLIDGAISGRTFRGPVTLVGNRTKPDDLKGHIALLVPDFRGVVPAELYRQVLEAAAAEPLAVLLLSNRDSVVFADRLRASGVPHTSRMPLASTSSVPVIEVHERAVTRVLDALGIDSESLRTSGEGRLLGGLSIEIRLARKILQQVQVPNVVGILEGSDPALRREYLVYSAHLDHIGITPGQVDSINNGADDNASGVAGLLELVEAFTQAGVQPKRSIIFLGPSAEEPGLLGSAYFTEHPPVPLGQVVADINMDLIGRNWRDSIIAVGIDYSDLGETLARVVQLHPELKMSPMADRWPEERIFYRSDHYHFARRGVPILFFTSGTHPDYHRPSDEADRIDVEKESRLLRLLFYLGVTVADRRARPAWRPESYREIVAPAATEPDHP